MEGQPQPASDQPKPQPNQNQPSQGTSSNPPAGPTTHACPECGKTFRTDEAVQTHRYAAHGTAEMTVGDKTRCPDCGSLVKNSHMAKHRRRMHGQG